MPLENVVETDVLVIGGGMAGCFAAIRAKEQGVAVILVDKGYASRSGSTPFPRGFMVFNPERGHKLDIWMNEVNTAGEYVNNREWDEIIIKESHAIYQEIVSWGVQFKKDENGNVLSNYGSREGIEALQLEYGSLSPILRKQVLKNGIKILDRIMITDLLKQDGKIVGAIGIPTRDYGLYIFKAKATVVCTGASSFKPAGFPISSVTGDGVAMAYRVGAEITGKEFHDTHNTKADYPAAFDYRHMKRPPGIMPKPKLINAAGDEVALSRSSPSFIEMELEAHAGRAPLYRVTPDGKMPVVGGAGAGYGGSGEGIWIIDTKCATSLPGLYTAGESCGSMHIGAAYCGGAWGLPSAAATGIRAGLDAAEYAKESNVPEVNEEELVRLKNIALAPVERKGGFSPGWVTQVLQNTVTPYFILYVKKEDRLKATLTIVEFLRDHLVPKLFARDPHELRQAHETKNMVHNAETKLRASLFRTESRGTHYREDYPRRDDPSWLAWVLLKEENSQMKAFKKSIPKEWWPDLSKPYKERYPASFPGE